MGSKIVCIREPVLNKLGHIQPIIKFGSSVRKINSSFINQNKKKIFIQTDDNINFSYKTTADFMLLSSLNILYCFDAINT